MIEHIFFAHFDVDLGAKLVVQEPEEYADEETFKKISPFIITNPELCGQVIALRFGKHQIVHYPVCINDTAEKKYPRNKLHYSVGVVIPADHDHERYEMIVRKLALFLKKCEQEDDLISNEEKFNAFKPQFRHIWQRLTQDGVVISFQLDKIKGVDVPSLKEAVENALPSESEKTCTLCHVDEVSGRGNIVAEIWLPRYPDTQQRQTSYVHNVILKTCRSESTVTNLNSRIQALEGCGNSLICNYLAIPRKKGTCEKIFDAENRISLKLFRRPPLPGAIQLHDVPMLCLDGRKIFNKRWDFVVEQILNFVDGVNNVLAITKKLRAEEHMIINGLRQLLHYRCITLIDTFQFTNRYTATPEIHKLARDRNLKTQCVAYTTRDAASSAHPRLGSEKAVVLLKLYAALTVEETVEEFAQNHALEEREIKVQQFIVFGVVYGIIRRVHEYPICRDRNHELFNGMYHMDYICCQKEMSRKGILQSLQGSDYTIIYK